MSNVWERFEGIASVEEVKGMKNAYAPIPSGVYECVLNKLEPSENKNGLPMMKGMFTIIEGGRRIFVNQNLQSVDPKYTPANIERARAMLATITGEDFDFAGLTDLAERILRAPIGEKFMVKVSYKDTDTDMKYPNVTVESRVTDGEEYEYGDDMEQF